MWPDFGHVEDVPFELLCVFGIKDLDVHVPGWVVASSDSIEEVFGVPIWVHCRQMFRLFVGQGLISLVLEPVSITMATSTYLAYRQQMYLHVLEAAIPLRELKGVSRVSIHVTIAQWRSTVAEQVHDLMDTFLIA